MSSGQIAAKEASKAAQRAKEEAAHAKKQAAKDKIWEVGAKDTSSQDAAAQAAAEAKARKDATKAAELAEGGGPPLGGGPVMKTCKDCKKKYNVNSKKGCPNCLAELFGGASPAKGKKK